DGSSPAFAACARSSTCPCSPLTRTRSPLLTFSRFMSSGFMNSVFVSLMYVSFSLPSLRAVPCSEVRPGISTKSSEDDIREYWHGEGGRMDHHDSDRAGSPVASSNLPA